MPVTYQIDRELALVRTRCTGDVAYGEVLEHFRELQDDSSLPTRIDVLLDLTELDSIPESDQLRSVSQEVESLRPSIARGSCAVVAKSDVLFGMSRVFQAFAEAHFARFIVVRELDEAEQWLASFRSPAA